MTLLAVIEQKRKEHFPIALQDGISAHAVDFAEISALMNRMWGDVFGKTNEDLGHFQTPPARKPTEALLYQHYCSTVHHEFIAFKDEAGSAIGWFIGEAEDYTTFYLRNGGGVPERRGQGLLRLFLPAFLSYLRDIGYERVTSQHHPNNPAVLIAMLKSGFLIEGMNLDERSGPLIKTVGYLQEDRRQGYQTTLRLPSYDLVLDPKSKG